MTAQQELTASDKLIQEITVAIDASIGAIVIRCPATEVYRVVDDLYSLAITQNTEFRMHTAELGWQEFERVDPEDIRALPFDPLKPQTSDKSTAAVAKAFEALYSEAMPQEGFFVMLDLYFNFPEMVAQTHIRKQVQRSLTETQRLFLIVPDTAEIPEALAPLLHVIEFERPTREELGASLDDLLENLVDEDDDTKPPQLTDDERAAIISNGQGMTAYSFETAVALAVTGYSAKHGSLEGLAASDIMETIREYKTQMLRKTNVLELQPAVDESEIGGLDLFKEWMRQRKATYEDNAVDYGVTPSRGALVVGPPGTGKSLVAKAAGSALNLPVIRFDVGRVFGQYVGQSEQSMRAVLALIDAMAPCVLMLDEIDKGFAGMAGGGGDSGTTQRVFGTFLTWMQERNQLTRPVFLIMTANRIQGLPPELLRKGRVDEIWAVNVPNTEEREQIVKIHLKKRKQSLPNGDIKAIVRITDGLVGAEIEALIEDALVLSLAAGEPGVTYEFVEQAKATLKPMSDTRKDEFEAMKEWAAKNARPASSPMQYSSSGKQPQVKRGKRQLRKPGKVKVARPDPAP